MLGILEKIYGFICEFYKIAKVIGFPLGAVVILVVGIFGSKRKDGTRDWMLLVLCIIGAILVLVARYGTGLLVMHFLK